MPSTPMTMRMGSSPARTPSMYYGTPKSRSGGTHSTKRQKIGEHTPVYITPSQLKAQRRSLLRGHHQEYLPEHHQEHCQQHRQEFNPKLTIDPGMWSQNTQKNTRALSPGNSPRRTGRTIDRPGHEEFLGGSEEEFNSGNLEVIPTARHQLPVRTSWPHVILPTYDPTMPMHLVSAARRYRTRSVPILEPHTSFEDENDSMDYGPLTNRTVRRSRESIEFSSKERKRRPDSGSEDEFSREGFPSNETTRYSNTATRRSSRRFSQGGSQRTCPQKMYQSNSPSQLPSPPSRDSSPPRLRRTRRTKSNVTSEEEDPGSEIPDRWSQLHPEWEENWRNTIIYGKAKATVEKWDIERLDDGVYLNDSIIEFYLRWLEEHLQPQTASRIYIFNTFFYKNLTTNTGKQRINYQNVRRWTSKVDIFSYDYIIVPVNLKDDHWYVAIICNPGRLLALNSNDNVIEIADPADPSGEVDLSENSAKEVPDPQQSMKPSPKRGKKKPFAPRKYDASQPRIITLDSLEGKYSATCTKLKSYLIAEAQDKKGVQVDWPHPVGMSASGIPQQPNDYDCGVFLLSYIEEFLKQPDEIARKIMHREALDDIDFQAPLELRDQIRNILLDLQAESQSVEIEAKKKAKK